MIEHADLHRIAEAVAAASGIVVRPSQYDALEAAIGRAFGVDRAVEPEVGPLYGPLLERLIDEVAVKETTFLRDREQLERIDWTELAARARSDGDGLVRVWSAGCATGEEAYSLAMLACEAFPHVAPPVRVVGSDLSVTALTAARVGSYRERSLREVEQRLRETYFERTHDGYLVGERLRGIVSFAPHNLVRDPIPLAEASPVSVVVCRNVFIYFDPATVDRIVATLRGSLPPGGLMIIGATDALSGTTGQPNIYRVSPPEREPPSLRPATATRRSARRQPGGQPVPPIPTPESEPIQDARLIEALQAADDGRNQLAVDLVAEVLRGNVLNAEALFIRGVVQLAMGDPEGAATSLRAAVYAEPSFGLAAFMLGRAHDAAGESLAARRAYERSLRLLSVDDSRHGHLLAHLGVQDVAAACEARLESAS